MSISVKDIKAVIRELKYERRQLEALLLHSDDFFELLRFIRQNSDEIVSKCSDDRGNYTCSSEMWIFGVKIVESRYAQPGLIHKIFKKGP